MGSSQDSTLEALGLGEILISHQHRTLVCNGFCSRSHMSFVLCLARHDG